VAEELHFPAVWDRFTAWGDQVEVVDLATGKVLERVNRVDAIAGSVSFERWNQTTGEYEVVVQERAVELRLKDTAPTAAREWFSLPIGDELRRPA
jgi:hypothetical protein